MKNIRILFVLFFCLQGCATTANYEAMLKAWVGQPVDNLVMRWGPPQSRHPLNAGGEMIEYDREDVAQIGGYTYTTPETTYQSGTTSIYGNGGYANGNYSGTSTTYVQHRSPVYNVPLICKTRFVINDQGIIVNWSWQGNNCKSSG